MLPELWILPDILALSMARGMTASALRNAVEQCSSYDDFFASPDSVRRTNLRNESLFSPSTAAALRNDAEAQLELCRQSGVEIVSFWDDAYPPLLREIPYPPTLLFVRGTLEHHHTPVIGMVGTRKCTQYGQLTAERFARAFVEHGAVVTSGLANGIDMYSHKAAVKAGGKTYAVIASGIDRISPHYSAKLAEEIAEHGAVISEYRCGTSAIPAYFPQRNRIISGLSQAVVVVESGMTGGALITAQFCFDQNRELFAVPGNITSEKSAGTNLLIRKNMAAAALSPENILQEIGVDIVPKTAPIALNFAHAIEQAVYVALSAEPQQIDDLAAALSLPPQDIVSNLLMLEFKGMARQLAGKLFVRG